MFLYSILKFYFNMYAIDKNFSFYIMELIIVIVIWKEIFMSNLSNKIFNKIKNKRQVFYLSFFILTYFLTALNHIFVRNFFLSRIFSIFLGIISLYFLNKAYIIPKKSHFILQAILFIFIGLSLLSLFLV